MTSYTSLYDILSGRHPIPSTPYINAHNSLVEKDVKNLFQVPLGEGTGKYDHPVTVKQDDSIQALGEDKYSKTTKTTSQRKTNSDEGKRMKFDGPTCKPKKDKLDLFTEKYRKPRKTPFQPFKLW